LFVFGGDYMLSLFLLRVVKVVRGVLLVVIYFDVYFDMWDIYFGVLYIYGIFFWWVLEEGLFDIDVCVHVGFWGLFYFVDDLC